MSARYRVKVRREDGNVIHTSPDLDRLESAIHVLRNHLAMNRDLNKSYTVEIEVIP